MSDPTSGRPDDLDSEIDSALDGINLQEVDLPASRAVRSTAGGSAPGRPGERLYEGTIVGVHGDDVIVELGPRMQGIIQSVEFEEEPKVGETYSFTLRGRDPGNDELYILSRKEALTLAKWQELAPGKLVKAKVTGQNTGGLELKIGPLPAFMPASHAALRHVEDLSVFIGEAMVVEVLEVDPGRKRCTVSRRNVLQAERDQSRAETLDTMAPGQVVRGKVSRIEKFGAFVEIAPGVEGLLHVSNLSRQRVEDPASVLKQGESIEVMILDIQEGGKRIGLGRKQLEPNPWDDLAYRLPVDTVVSGRVTRIADFGAFVEIEPGVEGLLHVSQLGRDRVARVRDAVQVGQEVSVRIVAVEPDRERLSLSRLDERGAVLGSEDAADAGLIQDLVKESQQGDLGTNLGSLFKKALKKDPE